MATIISYVRPLFCLACFIFASCILGMVDPTDMYSQRQHSVLRTIRDESSDYLMSCLMQECRRMRYNPAGYFHRYITAPRNLRFHPGTLYVIAISSCFGFFAWYIALMAAHQTHSMACTTYRAECFIGATRLVKSVLRWFATISY